MLHCGKVEPGPTFLLDSTAVLSALHWQPVAPMDWLHSNEMRGLRFMRRPKVALNVHDG